MNKIFRRYLFLVSYTIVSVLLIATVGAGQTLTIGGGNQTITLTTGIAGGQLVNVINVNTTLDYTTPPGGGNPNYKITVSSSCMGQRFGLSVLAINLTGAANGTPAPEVVLSSVSPAVDFITGIRKNRTVTCTLQYTASATFAQGNSTELGNDVHDVTYTIQIQ